MPIFEYHCNDCGKKINVLILNRQESTTLHCPRCKSENLQRLFSRFASPRSEETRLESLADPAKWSGLNENDPKSVVKFMKKMGKEVGEDLGEDYDQMIEEAEKEAYEGKGTEKTGDSLYTPGELSE